MHFKKTNSRRHSAGILPALRREDATQCRQGAA